ncbi:hypothetical protein AB0N89_20260 [Amycolatopsis sp. NPDC089917]|uniref:hypothetical protein n=1 Tax=Amycolatopsis sp. NPDC089917 TaxID=3155187 RepID=UPI00341C07FE
MRSLLRDVWPYPLYRWPLLVALLAVTSVAGLLGRVVANTAVGIAFHLGLILVVLGLLGRRTRRRRCRSYEDTRAQG